MREIRFRGKRISDNKWVYGYFLVNQFGEYTICDKTFSAAVIPETVGQYIGLPDKNNKEIYGGDILKFDIMGDMEKYNPLKALLVIVEYQNASWGFRRLYPELVVEEDREWCSFGVLMMKKYGMKNILKLSVTNLKIQNY